VAFKGVFNVLGIPGGNFGLIKVIEQVACEIEEARFIKLLSERSLDEIAGLFSIHFDSKR
jgi:hypothetical protein